jgi:hypothetical protein
MRTACRRQRDALGRNKQADREKMQTKIYTTTAKTRLIYLQIKSERGGEI